MYSFKKAVYVILLLAVCLVSKAQTNISGIINKYAAVTTVNFCANYVVVNSTTGFTEGQKVMIIQMKGALIDGSNAPTYGDVLDYKGAGNYEINEIEVISGNVVKFKYALARNYEASGAVQIVSLQEYTDAVVTAPLTAPAWNGSTGGIVLLKANTLTLNDSITVKGKGFRGAIYENDNASQACFNNGTGGALDFYCATVACGAPKGEGIGDAGFNYGRGKNGNGGGGGNDHNTGGGGGSNFGAGGAGGRRSNTSNFSCPGPAPGIGGGALTYTNAAGKIFMGGGGGAGDGNNNEQTSGGTGGGIVIIMANTLIGNNKKINANADDVNVLARSDGAGGGGGGGTVLLYVDNYSSNIRVEAVGGDGGILDNGGSNGTNAFCMGPGGGGGGGALWVKGSTIPGNISFIDTGGHNGYDNYGLGPVNCPYGTTNGAESGSPGGTISDLTILIDTLPFVQLDATACCDTTVCAGSVVELTVTDTATFPPTIEWSNGATTNSMSMQYFNTTDLIVNVIDIHGCIIQNNLRVTVENSLPDVTVCCDTDVCVGAIATFTATVSPPGQYTYAWSSGQNTSSVSNTVFNTQAYTVSVTDVNGCSVQKSVNATVNNAPPSLSVCCDTFVCAGNTVTGSATSPAAVSYQWSTGQNTATIETPVAFSTTIFVTITDANGCKAVDGFNANAVNAQTTITAMPDTAIYPGDSVQLNASGSPAFVYTWSPAGGLNNSSTANPVASPSYTTTYCITVTDNYNCPASDCYTVNVIQQDIVIKVPDAFTPGGNQPQNRTFTLFPLGDAQIFEMRIYNRWGEMVYYADSNIAWDGTYQGKPQPAGAYVIKVIYGNAADPKAKSLTKDFLLIR